MHMRDSSETSDEIGGEGAFRGRQMKGGWFLSVLAGDSLLFFHGDVAANYYDGLRAFDQDAHETAVRKMGRRHVPGLRRGEIPHGKVARTGRRGPAELHSAHTY